MIPACAVPPKEPAILPVVSIVGHSGSGKTTLMEGLVRELCGRGVRVAAVKHTRGRFEMDREGKDTWRFGEAGAEAVVALAPGRSALLRKHETPLSAEELLVLLGGGPELALVEGWHAGPFPKVEVHRAATGKALRCDPAELLAVVTDEELGLQCPQLPLDDAGRVADFLLAELGREAGGGARLLVNGEPVPIGGFTQRILCETVAGLVSTLKGVGEVRSASLAIRRSGARAGGKSRDRD
jgi:molybdopterin-guanine dinucleotide biosynthesis protein B